MPTRFCNVWLWILTCLSPFENFLLLKKAIHNSISCRCPWPYVGYLHVLIMALKTKYLWCPTLTLDSIQLTNVAYATEGNRPGFPLIAILFLSICYLIGSGWTGSRKSSTTECINELDHPGHYFPWFLDGQCRDTRATLWEPWMDIHKSSGPLLSSFQTANDWMWLVRTEKYFLKLRKGSCSLHKIYIFYVIYFARLDAMFVHLRFERLKGNDWMNDNVFVQNKLPVKTLGLILRFDVTLT